MYQNIYIEDDPNGGPSTVYLWDDKAGMRKIPYKKFRYAFVEDPDGPLTSIYGKRLSKIRKYRHVPPHMLYESDVPRETRILTDRYLNSDIPSTGHKTLIVDIEVSSIGGFAHPSIADKEITAISNYCADAPYPYTVFILDPENRIASREYGDTKIVSVPDEQRLLMFWLQYYAAVSPTILSGWNTENYDVPYIYNRLKRVFGPTEASWLSPINIVRWNENREKYVLAGVSSLDYLKLYQKFTYIEQPSYRLDAIGRFEVGMGKVEYSRTLDELYQNDIEKFVDYNLTDVRIVAALDKKLRLIDLVRFICHTGHVPYEDFSYSSRFIEGTILTYLHRKNIICPNKPAGGREKFDQMRSSRQAGITGAYVKEPKPGLYEWVYSLDLQSLYPSIIMSLNISPETKIGKVVNWDVDKHIDGSLEYYEVEDYEGQNSQKLSRREFEETVLKTIGCTISSHGVLYDKNRKGIIPEILSSWFEQRVQYKTKMKEFRKAGNEAEADFYDRRQHVQKILLNSIYGCLNLPIFRFYDADNGESVTKSGQDVIKNTAKYINSLYVGEKDTYGQPIPEQDYCIYIDTDSVYFPARPLLDSYMREPEDTRWETAATVQIAREVERRANTNYDALAKTFFNCDKHRFYIKGEAVMESGLWIAKKRYALKKVYDLESDVEVHKITYKGLDIVRSTFPPAFKHLMEDIIEAILNRASKEDIDAIITQFHTSLNQMDYLEVARNTSVKTLDKYALKEEAWNMYEKGTPIAVKAAVAYNRVLRHFRQHEDYQGITNGQKIKWVYLKPNPLALEFIACNGYDDPPEVVNLIKSYLDYEALFEGDLRKKLQNIYTAMNWGELPINEHELSSVFVIQ